LTDKFLLQRLAVADEEVDHLEMANELLQDRIGALVDEIIALKEEISRLQTGESRVSLKVELLTETAKPPVRATDGAAGFDLFADEDAIVPAKGQRLVSTGIAVGIAPGKCGQVWPRSGMDSKSEVTRGAGLIDADYRGPLKVLLINRSDVDYPILRKDRIAQLLITTAFAETVEIVEKLDETARGSGGFGSTGV
jgi:deoxyuridine 5'-triphosphate nucleotidohydrolase